MLRMFVGETQEHWDLYLPRVLFAYSTSYHEALGGSPFFSLYGRDSILPLDLAFLNTSNEWKGDEVAAYRRKLFLSMRDSRRMVERQLLKAQNHHARRLEEQVAVAARRGERKTKKLDFSWHGPYRVVGPVGENAYRVAIPSHPDRVVTVKVNRMKKYRDRMSRSFPHETPEGVVLHVGVEDDGPLAEGDLPSTSFVERIVIGDEETVFTGDSNSVLNGVEQYLDLTASYEVCWRPTATLLPTYKVLTDEFEDEERRANHWPELRRSARLLDANAADDEDALLF
ncbi:hypothetical protein PHMEG_00034769 [Phytophthora megakarya]|uniref:Tf2-1-like SH3-like domain-containing protein n=1 Tax=Phytophthora megakarya TaxID=4795 RepID=A0A225USV5_9STRA|nr:hypothetical protein PHMEG_00034769 [Phytophthora megakarya]